MPATTGLAGLNWFGLLWRWFSVWGWFGFGLVQTWLGV